MKRTLVAGLRITITAALLAWAATHIAADYYRVRLPTPAQVRGA